MIASPDDGIHQSTEIPKGLESDHRSRRALIQLDVSSSRPLPEYRLGGSVSGTARVAFKRGFEMELSTFFLVRACVRACVCVCV